MAGNTVLGKNVILQMNVAGNWFPFFCCKTAGYNQNQDELEVTSVASARDREYITGLRNATVDCTGVTIVDNTNSSVSALYLLQPAVIPTTFALRMIFTADNATVVTISFSGIITNVNLSRAFGSWSQSSVSFRVTGGLTFGSVIDPPEEPVCEVQDPLYLDLAEGATSVSSVLLQAAGVVILEVEREGLGHDEVFVAPGNREFRFTAGTGAIGFDTTNPGNPGGETIYVLYKLT